jgi:hypothetical protein
MEFRNPVASLGWGVFYLLIILAVVWVPAKALEKIVGMILTAWNEAVRTESETKIQLQRIQLQLAQSTPIGTSRTLGEDTRKAQIIQMVMARAYQFIETSKRNYEHNDSKPWAWKNAQGLEIDGDKPVTEREARRIRDWLQDMELIEGDQVNVGKYPDMNAVNRFLRWNFDLPIVYRSLPERGEDRGYIPIDENS